MSNWSTRLTEDMKIKYTASGDWLNLTINDFARKRLAECPDKVSIVDRDQRFTFRQIDGMARNLAASLYNLGIRKSDVISLQLPNWYSAQAINLAINKLGAVSNPVVPIYKEREVGFILRQARTKAMIIPARFRNYDYVEMMQRLQPDLPDLEYIIVGGDEVPQGMLSLDSLLQDNHLPLPEVDIDPNAVKLLMYTSGTTAEPKGVQHTHNTLTCELFNVTRFWGLNQDDVVFMPSPVTHITGCAYALEYPFIIGCSAVLMDTWHPEAALALIEREKCTFTVGATPFLQQLIHSPALKEHDVSSLKIFACGGASVPPELIREVWREAGWHAFRVYGSTEAPTVTLGIREDGHLAKAAETDGLIYGFEVQIVDFDNNPVPLGRDGEIAVRGPELFVGYKDDALNKESFDADGWFHTGDLGRVDSESYIEITGRKKDIIIRGGENISAKEIEDLLHMHPSIEEAAVVAMPDAKLGEKVCAYARLREGKKITFEEMLDFLTGYKLAKQKLPERLEIIDVFPATPSGKIKKNELRLEIAGKLGLPPVRA
ncbi:MAG: AMP-binding protein [Bacillota bacterium]